MSDKWHEEFSLFKVFLFNTEHDMRFEHLVAAKDFEAALEIARELCRNEYYYVCGVWEIDPMLITQVPDNDPAD